MSSGLLDVLEEARSFGFLGPGPVEDHLVHARGFAATAVPDSGNPPECFVDLGSGGGVPALVLLDEWPETRAVLIESLGRRAHFLESAVDRLGWSDRVEVSADRAELVARSPAYRERFPLATARSFGAPPVVAEIAAGLVITAGVLVVSEPPDPTADRWPASGLAELGFGPAVRERHSGAHFVRIAKVRPAPPDRPRPEGRPKKRPLW